MRLLVICNAYPSAQSKYRNGFIHRRVRAYQDAGFNVEVFYEHEPVREPYSYAYEGVQVRVGNELELEHTAASGGYDAFLVHFAEPSRIDPLRRIGTKSPVIVWIHGYEAEAWYRRWFNFIETPQQIHHAISRKQTYFKNQNRFLRELIMETELNIAFVNVSEWFQKFVVEPDIGAEFKNSAVIPNLIDENLFYAQPKEAEDRKKILTLRPFVTRKYANDLTVEAIKLLSERPYFEDLEFTICGQGPLFEPLTEPLHKFGNVTVLQSFFSHDEIRSLHSSHGVFLSPTRFDSQGVSMCEAMSSGLTAVSTHIAAIPEYVHHMETGLLATPESPQSLADNIERLYFDEELFLKLSKSGAEWMHANCGYEATIGKEIALISEKVNRE